MSLKFTYIEKLLRKFSNFVKFHLRKWNEISTPFLLRFNIYIFYEKETVILSYEFEYLKGEISNTFN